MSVKVGVRVRPFNKRQKQLNCKCCVQMIGSTTHVHLIQTNDQKSFVFDYSFWSHDKFEIDDNGIYHPTDNKYADQKKVYNQIGNDILINAWQGYNCCLFAYGQTGSGKSYSMLGYGANKGIIPMVCDNIFQKISKNQDKSHCFQVKVSMMEIYNQSLRDLLSKQKKSKELKIKQTKKVGVYVEGLVKSPVQSYQEIAQKIDEGSNNRSIAATLMNQSSSRSHTIVSISFLQKIQVSIEQTSVKFSTIHLVDLAGSQSVGKTGIDSKDRLREAAKINQSLSTLGRVIEILAENSGKTEKDKAFVPYRDSKLTFILKNALGGNSRTAMICAISPANDNYQQTLSTLRYASRAKKIQNRAIVNQSDVDKLIRTLKQQNEKLKQLLKQARMNKSEINAHQENLGEIQDNNKNMDNGIIVDQELMEEENFSEMGKDDKDKDCFFQNTINILDYNEKIDQSLPYITNLNEDQLLTKKVKYSCSKQLTIGNKQGVPRPNVVLSALGILPLHCVLKNQQGKLLLQIVDEQASEYTYLNGKNTLMKNIPVELMNCDRLIFGTQCVFLVQILNGEIRRVRRDGEEKEVRLEDIDYEYAILEQKENYLTGGVNKVKKVDPVEEQQMRKKVIDEIQQQFIKMKEVNEQQNKKKLEEQELKFKEKMDKIERERLEEVEKFKLELQLQAKEASQLRDDKAKSVNQLLNLKQMEKKLEENINVDKQALEKARKALDEKKETIDQLQKRIEINTKQIKNKEIEMREEIQKKQKMIEKQLQVKMIICNNENILNNYRHEEEKKIKKKKQLKEILLNSQKIQRQNQLLQLLPMIQRFNLMSKEMKMNIECKISINYHYVSQNQYLEILEIKKNKNSSNYFLIQVINRNQNRCCFWTIDVFKYRYEVAESIFNLFCSDSHESQKYRVNEKNPYWDPPSPQVIGYVYLLLQPLFNLLDLDAKLSIVKHGKKLGEIHTKIYPVDDSKQEQNLSKKTMAGITLHNPRDFVEKSLHFRLELSSLVFYEESIYSNIQIQFQLQDRCFKKKGFEKASDFNYSSTHILYDLSQSTIQSYMNKPMCITIFGHIKQLNFANFQALTEKDESEYEEKSIKESMTENETTVNENFSDVYLTPRHKKEEKNGHYFSSEIKEKGGNVASKCGILVNETVMGQIDKQYNESKQKVKVEKKKKKKEDCILF